MSWPAIKTPDHTSQTLRVLDYILAATVVWIAIPLFAGLLAALLRQASVVTDSAWGNDLLDLLLVVFVSPVFSWFGLLVGLPMMIYAARHNFAGWATAVGFGAAVPGLLIGLVFGNIIDGFKVFIIPGALFAGVFWLTLRLCNRAAFAMASSK